VIGAPPDWRKTNETKRPATDLSKLGVIHDIHRRPCA
jgi:hypothetical protein